MRLVLVAVGKLRSSAVRALCEDYLARLQRYGPAECIEVKAAEGPREQAVAQEGSRLLAALQPVDEVFVLDERGTATASVELSEKIQALEMRAVKRVVFLLGGAYGFSAEVRQGRKLLSLSKLTLPHELCRVLILEQLYRARTIQHGEPYHHA